MRTRVRRWFRTPTFGVVAMTFAAAACGGADGGSNDAASCEAYAAYRQADAVVRPLAAGPVVDIDRVIEARQAAMDATARHLRGDLRRDATVLLDMDRAVWRAVRDGWGVDGADLRARRDRADLGSIEQYVLRNTLTLPDRRSFNVADWTVRHVAMRDHLAFSCDRDIVPRPVVREDDAVRTAPWAVAWSHDDGNWTDVVVNSHDRPAGAYRFDITTSVSQVAGSPKGAVAFTLRRERDVIVGRSPSADLRKHMELSGADGRLDCPEWDARGDRLVTRTREAAGRWVIEERAAEGLGSAATLASVGPLATTGCPAVLVDGRVAVPVLNERGDQELRVGVARGGDSAGERRIRVEGCDVARPRVRPSDGALSFIVQCADVARRGVWIVEPDAAEPRLILRGPVVDFDWEHRGGRLVASFAAHHLRPDIGGVWLVSEGLTSGVRLDERTATSVTWVAG